MFSGFIKYYIKISHNLFCDILTFNGINGNVYYHSFIAKITNTGSDIHYSSIFYPKKHKSYINIDLNNFNVTRKGSPQVAILGNGKHIVAIYITESIYPNVLHALYRTKMVQRYKYNAKSKGKKFTLIDLARVFPNTHD